MLCPPVWLFAENISQIEEGLKGAATETAVGVVFDAAKTGVDSGYKHEYDPKGIFQEWDEAAKSAGINGQDPFSSYTRWSQDKLGEKLGGLTTKEVLKSHVQLARSA